MRRLRVPRAQTRLPLTVPRPGHIAPLLHRRPLAQLLRRAYAPLLHALVEPELLAELEPGRERPVAHARHLLVVERAGMGADLFDGRVPELAGNFEDLGHDVREVVAAAAFAADAVDLEDVMQAVLDG